MHCNCSARFTQFALQPPVRKHIIEKFGDRPLKELSYYELQTYINNLVENEAGYSLLQKVTYYLRTILDGAVEDGLIDKNPAASGKRKLKFKVSRKKGNYHRAEECKRLLAITIGRERVILLLLIQLGLRSEEVFALRGMMFRKARSGSMRRSWTARSKKPRRRIRKLICP